MLKHKYEVGILLVMSLAGFFLLPVLTLTGYSVSILEFDANFSENGLNISTWLNGTIAGLQTNFSVNFSAADQDPAANCTVGYNFKGQFITENHNMTLTNGLWVNQTIIDVGGEYYYNFTCYNGSVFIFSSFDFNLTNNTNMTVEEPSLLLTSLNYSFNATYNDSSFITGADCVFRAEGSAYNMSELADKYTYSHIFTTGGTKNYSISCEKENLSTQWHNSSVDVLNFFNLTYNFTAVTDSSVAWGDIDGDDDWDLVYTGDDITWTQKCTNTNGALSCSDSAIPSTERGSINLGDLDNDGDLDYVSSGRNTSGDSTANIYDNSAGSFSFKENVTAVQYSSSTLIDSNRDGFLDLFLSGTTTSSQAGVYAALYFSNQTSLIENQIINGTYRTSVARIFFDNNSFPDIIKSGRNFSGDEDTTLFNNSEGNLAGSSALLNVQYGDIVVGDLNNDSITDVILSGSIDGSDSGKNLSTFLSDGSTFTIEQSFNGTYRGSLAVGDYNNDGYIDVATIGDYGDNNDVLFYKNNGTALIKDSNHQISGARGSSLAFYDYDEDGDLDLAVTGGAGVEVYINQYSLLSANTQPTPPDNLTITFDNGWLNLTWNNGSDDTTPVNGLYYNIRVGTTPGGNNIISGKYGGSSNPTQGYLGNMMQLKTYDANVTTNTNYYFSVQSIDAGLRASAWSTEIQYNPCNYTSGDWTININCNTISTNLSIDGNVIIDNGGSLGILNSTLNVTGNITILNGTLNSNHSTIYGTLEASNRSTIALLNNTLENIIINASTLTFDGNTANNVTLNANDTVIIDSSFSVLNVTRNNVTILNVSYSSLDVSGSANIQWYVQTRVTNTTGYYMENATVQIFNSSSDEVGNNLTASNGRAYFNITQKIINSTHEISANNHTINVTKELYITNSTTVNISSNSIYNITLQRSNAPDFSDFNFSTNFSAVPDPSNVSEAYIGQSSIGLINFSENINVSGLDLNALINISPNNITVNPTTGINVTANLTFYGLVYESQPLVLRNGVICTTCNAIVWDGENLSVNVSGFSSYTTTNSSSLSASTADYDGNNKSVYNEQIFFLVNYTNISDSSPLAGNCSLLLPTQYEMNFNSTSSLFEYNISFSSSSRTINQSYTVNCTSSEEDLNVSSSVLVEKNETLLNSRFVLEGTIGSSLALAPLLTQKIDLLSIGENTTLDQENLIYSNTNNSFESSITISEGINIGSVVIKDYDLDGDYDIILIGFSSSDRIAKILENQ